MHAPQDHVDILRKAREDKHKDLARETGLLRTEPMLTCTSSLEE